MKCTSSDGRIDTECFFGCNPGYNLVGSISRTCLPVAMWDGIPAHCKRQLSGLRCDSLFHEKLESCCGYAIYFAWWFIFILFTCSLACFNLTNYYIFWVVWILCLCSSEPLWQKSEIIYILYPPIPAAVFCPPMPPLRHGSTSPSSCLSSKSRYGTECNFTCSVGFLREGPDSTHCGRLGRWADDPAEVRCIGESKWRVVCRWVKVECGVSVS